MLKGGPKDRWALHILAGKAPPLSLGALKLALWTCADDARLERDAEHNNALLISAQAGNESPVQGLTKTRGQLHCKRLISEDRATYMAARQ